MSATLLRNSTARAALRSGASASRAGLAGTSFVRTKVTLPDLSCRFLQITLYSIAFLGCQAIA